MLLNLDKVFYRAAAGVVSSLPSIGGTYPAATVSGWTAMPASVAEKAKFNFEPDVKTPMGDGTELVSSEKASVEITITDFTASHYGALRSAFQNTKVDLLAFDNEQRSIAYCVQGITLSIKTDITSGEEPKIILSGEKKAGVSSASTPMKPLT